MPVTDFGDLFNLLAGTGRKLEKKGPSVFISLSEKQAQIRFLLTYVPGGVSVSMCVCVCVCVCARSQVLRSSLQ